MKTFLYFSLVFAFCCLFQGCPNSCADKITYITLINETDDSLYVCMHCCDNDKEWPSENWHMQELPPSEKQSVVDYFKSDIENSKFGFMVWIAKKSTVDNSSLNDVMKSRLYDFVHSYSYAELEAMDFLIKIKEEDFKKNAEDSK